MCAKGKHRSAEAASRAERAALARERRKQRPSTKYGALEQSLRKLIASPSKLKLVWRKIDASADGTASLAEVYHFMVLACFSVLHSSTETCVYVHIYVCFCSFLIFLLLFAC